MREIWDKFVELLKHLAIVLIDSLFFVVWLPLQTLLNRFIEAYLLGLTSIDAAVFRVLQIVFAVSTVIPIVIALCRDFVIMAKRAQAAVTKA